MQKYYKIVNNYIIYKIIISIYWNKFAIENYVIISLNQEI